MEYSMVGRITVAFPQLAQGGSVPPRSRLGPVITVGWLSNGAMDS